MTLSLAVLLSALGILISAAWTRLRPLSRPCLLALAVLVVMSPAVDLVMMPVVNGFDVGQNTPPGFGLLSACAYVLAGSVPLADVARPSWLRPRPPVWVRAAFDRARATA